MLQNQQRKSHKCLFNSKFNITKKINHFLFKKYSKFEYSYSLICINYLISHEKCRIVARFKDFLIYDDNTEFINQFCKKKNLSKSLTFIFNFYSSYSKIYPNYLIIPENKFLYKNIRKKQRVIDEENALKFCTPKNKRSLIDDKILVPNRNNKKDENDELIFFNQSIVDSINRLNKSSYIKSSTKNIIGNINNSNSNNLSKFLSIITSDKKKSRNLNIVRKLQNMPPYNRIDIDFKGEMILNNNRHENNTELSLNTQSSSIINNNFYEDNTKSKASITEILNLINGKNNININNIKKIKNIKYKNKKNGSLNKLNNKKLEKIKNNRKERFKFLMLDINYIKKNIKTCKPKISNYNSIKREKTTKTPNKEENNNKQKTIKKIEEKNELNTINNNKNIVIHKPTFSCMEDISKIIKNRNKTKRQRLNLVHKLSNNRINSKENLSHYFGINTITSFGNIYTRKSKISDLKNSIKNIKIDIKYKIRRKSNSKSNKFFICSNTINSTINLGNTYTKINTTNSTLKQNRNCQKINENKKNYLNKIHNEKIMKSIESLISIGEKKRKSRINNNQDLKRVFKLEADSLQSTQVSINKKPSSKVKPKFSCIDKILTQIKTTTNNKSYYHKITNVSLSSLPKKHHTEFSHKYIKDKIISYETKPFPDYSQNITINEKSKLKKQRTSILIKNNNILDFFNSKDFYDLKINTKNIKNSNNKANISNNLETTLKKKKNKSTNKNYNLCKDLNIIDSHSFLLKTFNKENISNNDGFTNNKKSKIYKNHFNHFNVKNFKKNYLIYLCTNKTKCATNDKYETLYNFSKKHRKNNTTNICKNIEEIEKMKNEKISLRNERKNKIGFINSINKNNIQFQLKNKTPSKNLIKSLEIKISKNNNTNIKRFINY